MTLHAAFRAPGVRVDAETLIALRPLARRSQQSHAPRSDLPGGFVSRRRGRGLETADIRNYVVGDDIRHVDRNTTAKTGKLHVRTFQDEVDRTLLLVADFRPSMLWGTRRALLSVAAAEILTLYGWRISESGGRVGLLAITADGPVMIASRGRLKGMLDVIGGLTDAHARALATSSADAGEPELDKALEQATRIATKGSEVVLATALDTPGPAIVPTLAALAHRVRLKAVLLSDGFENAPEGSYPYSTGNDNRRRATFRAGMVPDDRQSLLHAAGANSLVMEASTPPQRMAGILDLLDGDRI